MYLSKTVAVVVPAKNEQEQIRKVLESMDRIVDKVFVVDDGSSDRTPEIVEEVARLDPRVSLIRHERSRGVGAGIASGYAEARRQRMDVTVVMAGDGQMDPADLPLVVHPVAAGLADYCKGNRFVGDGGLASIPFVRRLGNFMLSLLTKIVSGYWHVSDAQCGYTAIGLAALESIQLEKIYPAYGCPNDILVKLNIVDMRVAQVPVGALYDVGESSKMRVPLVVLPIVHLLARKFIERLTFKYVMRNGHPLVFAYLFAFILLSISALIGIYIAVLLVQTGLIMKAALITGGFLVMVGCNLLLTAFSMDCAANQHLCVNLPPTLIRELSGGCEGRVQRSCGKGIQLT